MPTTMSNLSASPNLTTPMTHPGLQTNQEEVGDFYLFIVVEHVS